MSKKDIIKHALANVLGAVAYIAIVAMIMTNAENIFGDAPKAVSTMAFLLLFTLSAAVMALFVFGRAALWYFEGYKKEAVTLVMTTILFKGIVTLVVLATLI